MIAERRINAQMPGAPAPGFAAVHLVVGVDPVPGHIAVDEDCRGIFHGNTCDQRLPRIWRTCLGFARRGEAHIAVGDQYQRIG